MADQSPSASTSSGSASGENLAVGANLAKTDHIVTVTLDPYTITSINLEEEHEWRVAIYDLIEKNRFRPDRSETVGPFALHLSIVGNYILLDIRHPETFEPIAAHYLSLTPFRGLIRDYFRVRESYYEAVRGGSAFQIETVDMGRRGLHNEAADLLIQRLHAKVAMDHETARRLFTLICAIQPYAARVDARDSDLPVVLFVCSMNSVRSPIAAALARRSFPAQLIARSAGVRGGRTDGFVHQVMDEWGIDMSVHTPHTLDELGALHFDLVVPLSDEAAKAVASHKLDAAVIEPWLVADPTRQEGSREQRLAAYRDLRDNLDRRIRDRLASLAAGGSQSA